MKFESQENTVKKLNASSEELNQSNRSIKSNRNDESSIEGYLERKNVKI